MILQIYAFKDKQLGSFLNPYYTDTTADNSAEHIRRFLAKEDLEKVVKYRHLVLYHLGEFNDVDGSIKHCDTATYLFDCDDVLDVRFTENGSN